MNIKMKKTFIDLLEKSLPNKSHPCCKLWRDYQIRGVERGESIISQLASHGISVQSKLSLDLGCGMGALSIALKRHGAEVISLDVSSQGLQIAKVRAIEEDIKLNLIRACGENLPLKPETFDLVFFIDVIEHVRDPEVCAKEIGRALKPDGFLRMNSPNAVSPGVLMRDDECQLPLISILPLWLAKKYAKIARQVEDYDVNKIPKYKFLIRIFEAAGITLFVENAGYISKIRDVTKTQSKKIKWTISILKKVGVPESFMLGLYIYLIPRLWTFVGQRND